MRTPPLILSISFLGFCIGCSGDPAAPGDTPGTTEPEAVMTVDGGGDTLQTSDFAMVIPPGAFSSASPLSLYRDEADESFGASDVNHVWRIEGVPSDFAEDLTIRVRFPDGEPADPMMAIGETAFSQSGARTTVGWRVVDAVAEDGWCVADFPALDSGKNGKDLSGSKLNFQFAPVYGYGIHVTPDRHFRISYPRAFVKADEATDLGTYLEEAYREVRDFPFSYAARSAWPVSVDVKLFFDSDTTADGLALSSMRGDNFSWININAARATDPKLMRLVAGHEFFHLAQSLFDPRGVYEQATKAGPTLWLDEAMSTWSEERFSDDANYIPSVWVDGALETFEGLQAGNGSTPGENQAHGYGAACVIQYIVSRWGTEKLQPIYDQILMGKHPVEAIEAGVGASLFEWWDDFMRDYVHVPIYGFNSFRVVGANSGLHQITSGSTAPISFTDDYPDLSARTYVVRLNNPNIDEDQTLAIALNSADFVISVYSYEKSGPLEAIAHDRYLVEVDNLKTLYDDGRHILVLVTHNRAQAPTYDQSVEATLTIQLQEPSQLPDFDEAYVRMKYAAQWTNAAGTVWDVAQQSLLMIARNGSFDGREFTAAWDSTDSQNVRFTGLFRATLNPATSELVSWDVESRWDYPQPNTYNVYNCSGGQERMTRTMESDNAWEYYLTGEGTCKSGPVSSIYIVQVNDGDVRQELIDFDCDASSYVKVRLSESDD